VGDLRSLENIEEDLVTHDSVSVKLSVYSIDPDLGLAKATYPHPPAISATLRSVS
jgi:hypothetical protein